MFTYDQKLYFIIYYYKSILLSSVDAYAKLYSNTHDVYVCRYKIERHPFL